MAPLFLTSLLEGLEKPRVLSAPAEAGEAGLAPHGHGGAAQLRGGLPGRDLPRGHPGGGAGARLLEGGSRERLRQKDLSPSARLLGVGWGWGWGWRVGAGRVGPVLLRFSTAFDGLWQRLFWFSAVERFLEGWKGFESSSGTFFLCDGRLALGDLSSSCRHSRSSKSCPLRSALLRSIQVAQLFQ